MCEAYLRSRSPWLAGRTNFDKMDCKTARFGKGSRLGVSQFTNLLDVGVVTEPPVAIGSLDIGYIVATRD